MLFFLEIPSDPFSHSGHISLIATYNDKEIRKQGIAHKG